MFVQPGAPELTRLTDAGLRESFRRDHPGQGTTNVCCCFDNAYLELLWLHDPAAAAGALLVSPADVEIIAEWYPELAAFSPMPCSRLEFPTIVVASSDDPYVACERAGEFAESWGAELVTVEAGGHINVESGHGPWPEGKAILQRLLDRI